MGHLRELTKENYNRLYGGKNVSVYKNEFKNAFASE